VQRQPSLLGRNFFLAEYLDRIKHRERGGPIFFTLYLAQGQQDPYRKKKREEKQGGQVGGQRKKEWTFSAHARFLEQWERLTKGRFGQSPVYSHKGNGYMDLQQKARRKKKGGWRQQLGGVIGLRRNSLELLRFPVENKSSED